MKNAGWIRALNRTRRVAFGRVSALLGSTELGDEFWLGLEEGLIQSDLGIRTTESILSTLKEAARRHGWTEADQLRGELRKSLLDRLQVAPRPNTDSAPYVILIAGVNGSGKTTTAARLANRLRQEGKSVLLATADTFRAAAADQLEHWGEKLGIQVVTGTPGSDAGAVVYEACQAAKSQAVDALVIDTSGRMHTSHNLMAELQKLVRVAGKVIPEAPQEILLVLDATTGQNGLSQARSFAEAIPVSGAVLAKLDSSARGGVAFDVSSELKLPIRYVGVGERSGDLRPFDPEAFVEGLLAAADPETVV